MKYFFAFLISSLFWVNYDINGLRITDFTILLSIPFLLKNQNKLSKKLNGFFIFFILLIFFSAFIGILAPKNLEVEKLVFIYKYMSIGFVVYIFINSIRHLNKLHLIFSIILFILSFWVYYYYFIFETITFKSSRVSFPFSNSFEDSDAHLYSYVLIILYTIRCFKKTHKYFFVLESIFILGALALTGSRLGLILFPIVFIYTLFRDTKKFFSLNYLILVSGILIIGIYFVDILFQNDLIARATGFNFSGGSSISRQRKINIGIEQIFNTFPFGNGNISSEIRWFDNGFIQILVSFGVFPTILILFYLFLIKSKLNKHQLLSLLVLFLSFFSAEFFLTTRGLVPTVFMFVYAKYSNNNSEFQIK